MGLTTVRGCEGAKVRGWIGAPVRGCAIVIVAMALLSSASDAQSPDARRWAESKQSQQHVASAMKIAGADLAAEAKAFCTPTGPQRPALARQAAGLAPEPDRPVEPIRIFDNLYYFGFSDVGAWAIVTSAGVILFDTLNSPDEARDVLVPG